MREKRLVFYYIQHDFLFTLKPVSGLALNSLITMKVFNMHKTFTYIGEL